VGGEEQPPPRGAPLGMTDCICDDPNCWLHTALGSDEDDE